METVYHTRTECCGCAACKQICPQNCITMIEDKFGYLYPEIQSESCIHCGRCKKVCPYQNELQENTPTLCYAYLNQSETYRLKSASSGAFEAICSAYFENQNNIAVFGSELDNELQVHHRAIFDMQKIDVLKKSKYLQSRIDTEFKQVLICLKEGKKVVFSGTPCQVAALKNFLGRSYENLFLVDFVCHGVPNQRIFDSYISYLAKKNRSKVVKYIFRNKKKTQERWTNLGIKYDLANGKAIELDANADLFMIGFLKGLFNRDSCYKCRFASTERVSDITIGDFWGIGRIKPEWDETVTSGTSLLLVNTMKGCDVITQIPSELLWKTELEDAARENGQLNHPQEINSSRAVFLDFFAAGKPFDRCMKKALPKNFRFKKEKIYEYKWYIMLSKIKKG